MKPQEKVGQAGESGVLGRREPLCRLGVDALTPHELAARQRHRP
jgi:hypothetical protein